jgi:hypothetical protein
LRRGWISFIRWSTGPSSPLGYSEYSILSLRRQSPLCLTAEDGICRFQRRWSRSPSLSLTLLCLFVRTLAHGHYDGQTFALPALSSVPSCSAPKSLGPESLQKRTRSRSPRCFVSVYSPPPLRPRVDHEDDTTGSSRAHEPCPRRYVQPQTRHQRLRPALERNHLCSEEPHDLLPSRRGGSLPLHIIG